MRFDSRAGHELRTWILFFVGIAIAIIFALNGNPLNPWWTLVIGAFTCTAVIVSAVQSLAGGMTDAAKRAVEEARRDDHGDDPKEKNAPTISIDVGYADARSIWGVRRGYTGAIYPSL